ncbi:hypothetical protein WS94_19870 [Burkholderia territorii]|nr:hypothetical protein WS94_19870 [Burkholderia territorii]
MKMFGACHRARWARAADSRKALTFDVRARSRPCGEGSAIVSRSSASRSDNRLAGAHVTFPQRRRRAYAPLARTVSGRFTFETFAHFRRGPICIGVTSPAARPCTAKHGALLAYLYAP